MEVEGEVPFLSKIVWVPTKVGLLVWEMAWERF